MLWKAWDICSLWVAALLIAVWYRAIGYKRQGYRSSASMKFMLTANYTRGRLLVTLDLSFSILLPVILQQRCRFSILFGFALQKVS